MASTSVIQLDAKQAVVVSIRLIALFKFIGMFTVAMEVFGALEMMGSMNTNIADSVHRGIYFEVGTALVLMLGLILIFLFAETLTSIIVGEQNGKVKISGSLDGWIKVILQTMGISEVLAGITSISGFEPNNPKVLVVVASITSKVIVGVLLFFFAPEVAGWMKSKALGFED